MAQNPHIIDLRRSYLPMDPNAFPPTLHATEAEDTPENRVPVIPYDGYNFMPTPQGYMSFFGTNSRLGVDALTGNVDYVFIIQKQNLVNLAIALKDDGIWTKDLASGGAWTQVIALAVPAPGVHKNWSRAIIDQAIYVYRQGEASHWKADPNNSYVFTAVVPTFLNMAGQLGIFKAGSRLGYWDSLNSISWSALDNTADFVPSLTTLAGNTIFQDIIGRIVNVLQHGTGFIIYCTRSIVHVTRNIDSPMLFSGRAIFNSNGISYRDEVCFGDPDTKHFANTTAGFCEITNGQPQFVSPEASTYFKSQRDPFYLQLLNSRYVFMQFFNPAYLNGRVDFNNVLVDGSIYTFGPGREAIDKIQTDNSPVSVADAAVTAMRSHRSVYLFDNFGYGSFAEADTPAEVPIFENKLSTGITIANITAWINHVGGQFGHVSYFDDKYTSTTIVPTVGANYNIGMSTRIPIVNHAKYTTNLGAAGSFIVETFSSTIVTETNQEDFYLKQNALWHAANIMNQDFYTNLAGRTFANVDSPVATGVALAANTANLVDNSTYVISDYFATRLFEICTIDFSPSSERNKYYGSANKSEWLERTLIKTKRYKVGLTGRILSGGITTEASWFSHVGNLKGTSNGDALLATVAPVTAINATSFTTYADMVATGESTLAANLAGQGCTDITVTFLREVAGNEIYDFGALAGGTFVAAGRWRIYQITATHSGVTGTILALFSPYLDFAGTAVAFVQEKDRHNHLGMNMDTMPINEAVYMRVDCNLRTEGITVALEEGPDLPLDICHELGYTQITGHGHYTDPDTFVEDDTIDEAPDYNSIFDPTVPPVSTLVQFNGVPISEPFVNGGIAGQTEDPLVINGTTYTFGDMPVVTGQSIVIPGGTILLQAGSIEPIYPTFKGAFIFDTHYRKWGKMAIDYKNLLDIWPINTMAGENIFPYDTFMPKVGARLADGTLPIFDEFPTDSELVFGKIGFYRKGFTDLEEVRVQHRGLQRGNLKIEASIDGRSIDATLTDERPYDTVAVQEEGFNLSARWYNVVFTGFFDLTSLEARGYRSGKR